LGISFNVLKTGFLLGKRGCANIDVEYIAEPFVFTDALIYHVLQWITISSIQRMRTDEKIVIHEHTPNAEGLDPFGIIGVHKKIIFHIFLLLLDLIPYLAAAEQP
jgi:hypothetical protein